MYELFIDHRKSYKSDDGNYYTYPRREHKIKRFEKPSIIQMMIRGIPFHGIILMLYILFNLIISFHSNCYDDSTIFILGIQRIFGIATAIRRQGFIGSLSGIAPVAVAGAATAGVFRNEIAAIVEDFVSEFVMT